MSLYPLPKAMPFRAKAELMVKRGEARDFRHACSLLGGRRKQAQPKPSTPAPSYRAPYKDE